MGGNQEKWRNIARITQKLARKAFTLTKNYDAAIDNYFRELLGDPNYLICIMRKF